MPYLPLPFFHPSYLREISNTFGEFLRADDRTLEVNHPIYARVCVEMEISKPKPTSGLVPVRMMVTGKKLFMRVTCHIVITVFYKGTQWRIAGV